MRKVIGVLAHVDAGKTTLSEALLAQGGAVRAPGRVERGDTLLDFDAQERARGITIFAGQAPFSWGGDDFTLLDTPGHVDFSAAMERTLAILDAAVLVVSAADGVQGHTETIWRRLDALHVPTFLFVNKCDRAAPAPALEQIRARLSPDCIDLTDGIASAAEALAERDEALLDAYFSHGYTDELFSRRALEMTQARRMFPLVRGAALHGEGTQALLHGLCTLLRTEYDDRAPAGAQVYGVRRLPTGERLTLVKVTSGTLRPRDPLGLYKIGELRCVCGKKTAHLLEARAGMCCAVLGLAQAQIGDGLGAAEALPPCALVPLLAARVECDEPMQPVLAALRTLEEEDPALSVQWDAAHSQLTAHIMGRVQLEVLSALLTERFGIAVRFGAPKVTYRETIRTSAIGVGHFEPLRHYAECVLRLDPAPPGSGIAFKSECPTDCLASSWQRLIQTHVFERVHRGVLTGAPLTDVCVTLLRGRAHEKHTEGGDFREATYRALRQGLMQAECVLLEPRVEVCARLAPALVGRFLSDVQKMRGQADAPDMHDEQAAVRALVPLAAWGDYPAAFAAYTRGHGGLSVRPGDWMPASNADEVIAAAAYQPEHDLDHTPDSVFCSHGAGYSVKWYDVLTHMHCKE